MSDCPTCGGSSGSHHHISNHKYDKIYLDILRVGQSVPHTGLSYDHLLSELRRKNYDLGNSCVELAVRHMFFHSFYHITDPDNPCQGLEDISRHSTCKFILKGEPSLLLLEHDNMRYASKISVIAAWLGAIAILVSILTLPRVSHLFRLDLDNNPTASKQPIETPPNATPLHSKEFGFDLLDSLLGVASKRKAKIDTSSH